MDIGDSLKSASMMHRQADPNVHFGSGNAATHLACNTTPTPRLRKLSDASEKSNNSECKFRNTHLVYDSGNYSTSSNVSDISGAAELEFHCHYECYHHILKEKDQVLSLAMHDIRKMRSELERLSKSEQWYKQELRTQKNTRLEALERLYSQERKYMQENQRLQRECMRLYANCGNLEKELSAQREAHKKIASDAQRNEGANVDVNYNRAFQLDQQRALISDQQQLIDVLRKQKRALLDDLKHLTEEKDEKVLELQGALASMNVENRHVTTQYKRLLNEKRSLEEMLQCKETALSTENAEKLKLQEIICTLREEMQAQEQLIASKEKEIIDLQNQFKSNIKKESNMDEVHRLSVTYHEDINAKTAEIIKLKKALQPLQDELNSFYELQIQNEQQERLIENLNFTIEALHFELKNLKEADDEKAQQISELLQNIEKFQNEHEGTQERLQSSQTAFQNLETELIALNGQYANMCALCERTRFELELLEIDRGKLEFQAESDRNEIMRLREKLDGYLKHINYLSAKINELEKKLDFEKQKAGTDYPMLQQLAEFPLVLTKEDPAVDTSKVVNITNETPEKSKYSMEKSCLLEYQNSNGIDNSAEDPDCVRLTEQQNKLLNSLYSQSEIMAERQKLLDSLNVLIDSENNSVQKSNSLHTISVNMKKLMEENTELKEQIHTTAQIQQIIENKPDEIQKNQSTNECWIKQKTDTKSVQTELFSCDAEPNQIEMPQTESNSHQFSQFVGDTEKVIELHNKNEILHKEIQRILDINQNIEDSLQKERNNVIELKLKLESALKSEPQELLNLRKKVLDLEDKLETSMNTNDNRRDQRIKLINQLILQQNNKVNQLNESKAEWEDLLKLLNETQKLEENTRNELKLKHAELEELNALFAEQNEELCKLQQTGLLVHCKSDSNFEQLQNTLQERMKEMEKLLMDKLQENEAQKNIIDELQSKNEILEHSAKENYVEKISSNQHSLQTLHITIAELEEDRNKYVKRVTEMECELNELRKSKRKAMVFPTDYAVYPETSITSLKRDSLPFNDESTSTDYTNDRLRLLTKVLEAEYRRKMKRYDLHIHSLLNNIKGLKRALRSAEQRATNLSEEQSRAAEELRDFQQTRFNLEEMRLKLDQSQCTIKSLERTLENERKRFEASDLGKSANVRECSEEPVHEVANLIDDYKKLIQQSAVVTRRPKTSTILDMIHRSNQFMPNLNKLETNVNDLRSDLEHFLNIFVHKTCDSFILPKSDVPSLLDELRAAKDNF